MWHESSQREEIIRASSPGHEAVEDGTKEIRLPILSHDIYYW